jgi:flavin reductase (DIM6/NTAB) family NADH-FMN oxidoreductase RutF
MSTIIHSNADILNMETRYRAAFINTLSGFKSAALIATVNEQGQTNCAVFNSVVHIGAHPPLLGFICRPDAVERHTLENIQSTGVYTINHIHEDIYVQAHQTSARYPKHISEFDATGLSPEYLNGFKAPFVKESTIKIAMQLKSIVPIAINGTLLVIGEIQSVNLPEDCMQSDGSVDIEKAGTVAISGIDTYHKTKRLAKLSYAKPNTTPTKIL